MNLSPQYLAGFFDGEGCISIHRRKKGKYGWYYGLRVSVGQKYPWILYQLQEQFKGYVCLKTHKQQGDKQTSYWECSGPTAESFLRCIYDDLLLKKVQADLAFAFCDHMRNFDTRREGNQYWNPDVKEKAELIAASRQVMYQQMKDLKVQPLRIAN